MKRTGRRVVITGVGPVTPIGIGKKKFWDSLVTRKSNYSEITRFPLYSYDKTRIAAQIPIFDPSTYVDCKLIESIDKLKVRQGGLSIYYGVAAAKLALEDAGISPSSIQGSERMGVIAGSGAGDLALLQRAQINFVRGAYSLANALPGVIAKELNINGSSFAVSGACTTGSLALHQGYERIRSGNYDLMFVGSTETPIDVPHFFGSEEERRKGIEGFSQRNDLMLGMCPFDSRRDGLILSEGAGILVLEELNRAQARGAHIYCEVIGYGEYTDFDTNLVRITKKGYATALRTALSRSGLIPTTLENLTLYVNAHGTATRLNDPCESSALEEVLGARTITSSFKGTLGHAQAAAPALELIGCALTLDHQCIPKTNFEKRASDCALLDYVTQARELDLDLIVKMAAGFNGIYTSTVLAKYKPGF